MASKRPREQQPGVVDEMANAIVRQVKAQRIVVNKVPVYACGDVYLHSAVVGEQRTYVVRTLQGTKKDPKLGEAVHFSSPKAAAEAFVLTVCASLPRDSRYITILGTSVAVMKLDFDPHYNDCPTVVGGATPASITKTVESVEQLLISGGVHTAVYEAA